MVFVLRFEPFLGVFSSKIIILAIKTGCFAPGGKLNEKSTAVLF
jgi:hypothetical protein